MITPTITVDFLSVSSPSSSSKVETALSVSAMELVTAANSTSRKKRIPTAVPNPMLSNTFGIVINIKDGPACSVSGVAAGECKDCRNDHQTGHDRDGGIEDLHISVWNLQSKRPSSYKIRR